MLSGETVEIIKYVTFVLNSGSLVISWTHTNRYVFTVKSNAKIYIKI